MPQQKRPPQLLAPAVVAVSASAGAPRVAVPTTAAPTAAASTTAASTDASVTANVALPPESASPPCLAQSAQEFLVAAHLSHRAQTSAGAQAEWFAQLRRSIRYRTEQYGYYAGFGSRAWNPRPLRNQLRVAKFAGLPVVLHERVIPALHCVEQAIERDCRQTPYRPHALGGARQTNTYFSGDVSNHVYGIALDIDPNDNPCCNCVEPWRDNPRCRGDKPALQRMAMPECWVSAFERYGFYWLGHDELKDTMHFEFLGDPSKISAAPSPE